MPNVPAERWPIPSMNLQCLTCFVTAMPVPLELACVQYKCTLWHTKTSSSKQVKIRSRFSNPRGRCNLPVPLAVAFQFTNALKGVHLSVHTLATSKVTLMESQTNYQTIFYRLLTVTTRIVNMTGTTKRQSSRASHLITLVIIRALFYRLSKQKRVDVSSVVPISSVATLITNINELRHWTCGVLVAVDVLEYRIWWEYLWHCSKYFMFIYLL